MILKNERMLKSTEESEAAQEAAIYAKVTRRLIPLLFVSYVVAYLDRVNVGFAKLQMLSDLRFSDTVFGMGAGIFFIGYFLFEIPSNIVLHRVGARVWIARIMITWGLISGAMISPEPIVGPSCTLTTPMVSVGSMSFA